MTVNDAKQAFTAKLGASEDRSGEHVFFYFTDGSSEYLVGKMSHSWKGAKQLPEPIIRSMAKKLNLTKKDFESFVECSLGTDDMLRKWRVQRPR